MLVVVLVEDEELFEELELEELDASLKRFRGGQAVVGGD